MMLIGATTAWYLGGTKTIFALQFKTPQKSNFYCDFKLVRTAGIEPA
jgi:hypothetical protein